jgi:5-methylcytosine-specific restriction endonuclease McrA
MIGLRQDRQTATPMLDSNVLVLNRVFQAVQVTSVRKAFSLFYKGHVRAVLPDYSTYEFENWCDIPPQPQDEVVLTPSMAIRIPRVVALKDYDHLPRQEVKFSRHNIYVRDGNRCQYCGHKFPSAELSLDHVIPLSRGGNSSWENVVCACLACNVRKGNRTPQEASMKLIVHPKKPRWHPVGHFGANKFHPAWRNFLDVAYWNSELK